MEIFLTCYDKCGIINQVSGVSEARKMAGETVADIEGKQWGKDFTDEKFHTEMESAWNKCLIEGGQQKLIVSSGGEWWAICLARVPAESRAISVSVRLEEEPPKLTERDIKILKMMLDDVPTCEQRKRLDDISPTQYASLTLQLRKKVGVKTNFGLVKWASKAQVASLLD